MVWTPPGLRDKAYRGDGAVRLKSMAVSRLIPFAVRPIASSQTVYLRNRWRSLLHWEGDYATAAAFAPR